MKRLLANLLIVLGLGLTFSVNANARDVTFCQHKESKSNLYIANTNECWNDRYKILSEQDFIIAFLYKGHSSNTRTATLKY